MDTLIHICTNPALISIILLCFLCVKKINVLLAIIISTILAGLTAGLDISHIMNTFISGMGGNSETALSYILLGAFAATMAHSGFTNIISGKINKVVDGKK
ncbi:TPA: sodium:proton antiporter, partial [Candidatus Gastranaerophilales bacterium HUM_13]